MHVGWDLYHFNPSVVLDVYNHCSMFVETQHFSSAGGAHSREWPVLPGQGVGTPGLDPREVQQIWPGDWVWRIRRLQGVQSCMDECVYVMHLCICNRFFAAIFSCTLHPQLQHGFAPLSQCVWFSSAVSCWPKKDAFSITETATLAEGFLDFYLLT